MLFEHSLKKLGMFLKKTFMVPFYGWGSIASWSHCEETICFLPLSPNSDKRNKMVLTNKQKTVIENDFNEKSWNACKIWKEHPSFESTQFHQANCTLDIDQLIISSSLGKEKESSLLQIFRNTSDEFNMPYEKSQTCWKFSSAFFHPLFTMAHVSRWEGLFPSSTN